MAHSGVETRMKYLPNLLKMQQNKRIAAAMLKNYYEEKAADAKSELARNGWLKASKRVKLDTQ